MPWLMFLVNFLGMFTFYVAHWQTYVTGTLTFGKVDVTEAQFTTYAMYALTGMFGDAIWNINVFEFNFLRFFKFIFKFFF